VSKLQRRETHSSIVVISARFKRGELQTHENRVQSIARKATCCTTMNLVSYGTGRMPLTRHDDRPQIASIYSCNKGIRRRSSCWAPKVSYRDNVQRCMYLMVWRNSVGQMQAQQVQRQHTVRWGWPGVHPGLLGVYNEHTVLGSLYGGGQKEGPGACNSL